MKRHQEEIPRKALGPILETLCRAIREATHADDLIEALELLEMLPLTTGDFSVAINRLKSAQQYFTVGEQGAAKHELRLLLGSLSV